MNVTQSTIRAACGLLLLFTAASSRAQTAPLPQIRENGAVKHLYVDGKPFIMLAGELHNSSASSTAYMRPVWDKLARLNLNTVIGTVSWELLEPEEGKFDFTLVDSEIHEARTRNMRLVLIWFATWKNASASYAPHWVKNNRARFPVVLTKPQGGRANMFAGLSAGSLTALGEASVAADSKAFRALMRHIREVDPEHTVIMMQVENEAGLLGDSRDRSPLAEAAWTKPVPADLMNYLTKNKAALLAEMQEVWGRNGFKTSGTWADVFGTDAWADEVFMAYHVAHAIGEVARAGKAELNLPMYANAWLGPQPDGELPGLYPSGGPVARMLDVYRAAAPSLDLIAPDSYVPDFKGTCALYSRSGNPLFIPEVSDQAGNLFWAFGHHAAWAWSPFGVEDLDPEGQVAHSYRLLSEMLPQLAEWQAAGKVRGILVADGEAAQSVALGGYRITLAANRSFAPEPATGKPAPLAAGGVAPGSRSMPLDTRPFALVVNTAPDEFLFIGSNGAPAFAVDSPGPAHVDISAKDEGRYEKGTWVPDRRLNGDELGGGLPNRAIGMLKVRLLRFD